MTKPLPVEGCVPRKLLESLQNKRVLITGSSGFCGRWVLETLLHADVGANITAWSPSHSERVTAYAGLCHTRDGDFAEFKEEPFDYIVDCSLDAKLCEACLRYLKPDGRMLLLSSGAVYEPTDRPMSENAWHTKTVSGHLSNYGSFKLGQEVVCQERAVIARLFTFIGPGLRRHTGKEFLETDPITVKNDGAVRSYMSAWDMVRWLWTILFRGKIGTAYNIGSNVSTAVTTFAVKCAEARKVAIACAEKSDGGAYYVPDTTLAETELGLRCEVGIDEAIRRTLEWQESSRHCSRDTTAS